MIQLAAHSPHPISDFTHRITTAQDANKHGDHVCPRFECLVVPIRIITLNDGSQINYF